MIEEILIDVLAELDASLTKLTELETEALNKGDESDIYEMKIVLSRTVRDLSSVMKWRNGNGTASNQQTVE
jgi:hypothetical protein